MKWTELPQKTWYKIVYIPEYFDPLDDELLHESIEEAEKYQAEMDKEYPDDCFAVGNWTVEPVHDACVFELDMELE